MKKKFLLTKSLVLTLGQNFRPQVKRTLASREGRSHYRHQAWPLPAAIEGGGGMWLREGLKS